MNARKLYQKIEILIATLITGFFIFIVATNTNYYSGRHQFTENHMPYNFNINYLRPMVAIIITSYLLFLFLTQYVETKTRGFFKVTLFICSYLLLAVAISVCETYIGAWRYYSDIYQTKRDTTVGFFINGFSIALVSFLFYLIYYGIKELIFNPVIRNKLQQSSQSKITFIVLSILAWLLIAVMLASNNAPSFASILWVVVVPYIIVTHSINVFVIIPKLSDKRLLGQQNLSRSIPVVLLLCFIAVVFTIPIFDGGIPFVGRYALLLLFTCLLVIPVSWWWYKNRQEKTGLKTALGTSEANLSFLRSQINPHFLFNALNTLYGTALQENAGRTGEGIQKLGDMMRFMLHENMQDKIALSREIDYLNNYIDLQKLRIATSSNIIIQTNIEEQLNPLQISPMLLIPFVENAFKHGISLQQSSYINISLHTKENVLFFDVNNSVHVKNEYDPENMKSGIGLQNVKQRLAVLYPQNHELIIRQSAKEFFVHLTISL